MHIEKVSDIIPAKLKRITKGDKEYWTLIFGLSDFIADKRPAEYEKAISEELHILLEEIKKMLPDGKPSKVKRKNLWEIGNMILNKREEISKKYGIYITNIVEAVAIKLNIVPRTVNFFVQFRNVIPLNKVDESIPWKVYQIALLLKDKKRFEECISLYKSGILKNTSEVLKYVQKSNEEL